MASLFKQSIKKEAKPKTTREASSKQEHSVAKAVGGRTTANSGASAFSKGDILTEQWLIEAKTKMTDSQSISIKKEWIEKNKQEAVFMNKDYHCIAFNFGPNQPNYFIIDELTFQELLSHQKENQ